MSLSTSGKEYIAQHFGASNCFVASGVSYTDPAGEATTGGTADVVATLKLDDGGLSRGPNGEVYDDIVTANGGAVNNADIVWITSNDGSPAGEDQYCAAGTPTPTPTPTPDTAVLTVEAYKNELQTSEITNGLVYLGAAFFGFTPVAKKVGAKSGGTVYKVKVAAEGRETQEKTITLVKGTPQTVTFYLKPKETITIKIAPGIYYISGFSGGAYQIWYIGTKRTGYVSIETALPGKFRAELEFTNDEGIAVPSMTILTEAKELTKEMSSTQRRLRWPYDADYVTPKEWTVPNTPGEFTVTGYLFIEEL